jgi:hypothetical protein
MYTSLRLYEKPSMNSGSGAPPPPYPPPPTKAPPPSSCPTSKSDSPSSNSIPTPVLGRRAEVRRAAGVAAAPAHSAASSSDVAASGTGIGAALAALRARAREARQCNELSCLRLRVVPSGGAGRHEQFRGAEGGQDGDAVDVDDVAVAAVVHGQHLRPAVSCPRAHDRRHQRARPRAVACLRARRARSRWAI